MKYKLTAYTLFNVHHSWTVPTLERAREHAKRVITEGLWVDEKMTHEKGVEVFYPVHTIFKVKIEEVR